jgi:APA family basic amino acid/polyamine antiporter
MDMDDVTVGTTQIAPQTFSRKASGLIRRAGWFDVFSFNVLNGIGGIISVLMLSLIPAFYPGANLVLTTILAALVFAPMVILYAKLSAVMPRSGGDYVYNSRIVHPGFGFAANLGITCAVVFLLGTGGTYTASYGIGPLLRVTGYYWSSQGLVNAGNWCTSSLGMFVLGIVVLAVFGALFIFGGLTVYWRVQVVLMVLATVSLFVVVLWALFVSRQTAFAHISTTLGHLGGKSLTPLEVGKTPPFSLWQSFRALLWPLFAISGCMFSAYIGGEVKQPAKSQSVGILGSLVWISGWLILVAIAMGHVFGTTFFANLTLADPSKYGLSTAPGYAELVGLGLGNGIAAVIFLAMFAVWGCTLTAISITVASRCVFAWSLDRVVPQWLSRVSSRWSSPYNAILVLLVCGAAFGALFSWKWLTILGATYGWYIAYWGVMAAGIILPFRQRALWNASPGNTRILGLPSVAFWGIVYAPLSLFCLYLSATDDYAGVSPFHNFGQFVVFPAIVAGGLVYYYLARGVQRSRGIDLALNFGEIPPE